jgi:signal transduction histidine kinase
MSPRATRFVSRLLLAAAVVLSLASIPLELANGRADGGRIVVVGDGTTPPMTTVRHELEARLAKGEDLAPDPWWGIGIFGVFSLVWIGTGSVIVSRQPGNWAGWLFCVVGLAFPVSGFAAALTQYGAKTNPGSILGLGLWAVIGEYSFFVVILLPLLFLLFPDGHPPTPRWRWAARALIAGAALAVIAFLLEPGPFNNYVDAGLLYENPIGIESAAGALGIAIGVGTLLAIVAALSTVVALTQRFRRSSGEERQKLRWLVYVAGLAGGLFALMWLISLAVVLTGGDDSLPIFSILFAGVALTLVIGVPAAYLIAIFRYGLWELDVVVRKAVLYGILVTLILIVGAAVILGAGGLVVGSPSGIDWVLVFAGVVMGLLFLPLRRLATWAADRLVFGKRATPYEVLTEFAGRVGETYSTDDVLPRMAHILAAGAGAERSHVWLRVGNELRPAAAWPEGSSPAAGGQDLSLADGELPLFPEGEYAIEVRHHGELLGALSVSMAASDPMNPSKAKLVQDLAAQAGLVLRNVRLIEELRASRIRLVKAQDEERRRLERNIHDGAQQQLVALSVKLTLVRAMSRKDPERAQAMLQELQAETQDAMENLRDLARGIYPPLLADHGLVAALESQARKAAVPVRIEADGIARYSQDAEAAIYFCTLEALQNVAKYAGASRADVRLREEDGALVFEVIDDGVGFDPDARGYGTGLQGMADRLAALGGELRIESSPGRGTTVRGAVPLGARALAQGSSRSS